MLKPIPFKISKDKSQAVFVQHDNGRHFYDRLHDHQEFQITIILNGKGILYAGNNMVQFEEGYVFLFGEHLPHWFKNTPIHYTDESPGVESISMFFDWNAFGSSFFQLKEMRHVQEMLASAKRGYFLNNQDIFEDILNASQLKDESLIIALLQILQKLYQIEKNTINPPSYRITVDEKIGKRLSDVLSFTFKSIKEPLSISDVAAVANLSKSQFSRYFKLHTGKSYIQFVNDLRIETACSLLLTERTTIEQICYEVGFQNISHFNRQFKKYKGLSPNQYRKQSWGTADRIS